jgi:UTP--glucose-1-phosphate uridylyltransferase
MAVVGRYVFSPSIWSLLEKTQPGVGGEIQLTDAIAALMEKEVVEALVLKGKKHDCGNKLGYVEAIFDYALRHPELGDAFKQYALAALRNQ